MKKFKEKDFENLNLDYIWAKREFIQNLLRVANEEYDKLAAKMAEDGMKEEMQEWLFDFVYNEDEVNFFDEWLFELGMLEVEGG